MFVPTVWLVFLSPLSIPRKEKGEYVHCGGWELAASNKSAGRGNVDTPIILPPLLLGPSRKHILFIGKMPKGIVDVYWPEMFGASVAFLGLEMGKS